MDIVTHALASLALVRGFFPRAGKRVMAAVVIAGTIADADWLSNYFGPSVFLTWRRTYFHSILAAILLACATLLILRASFSGRKKSLAEPVAGNGSGSSPGHSGQQQEAIAFLLSATLVSLGAALLHIAMDACQSGGVTLLWPFNGKRFALDWLPFLDPWILAILIAAVAIPELLRLVSSEIGAREKSPRGQAGAISGLALLLIYAGVRATLHSNAISLVESRTYHGETPRHAGAFPEALSLFTWHGIVETESALNEITVDAASPGSFASQASVEIFKPEPSQVLTAGQNCIVAREFLAFARFPKATVEKTETGYEVELRDLRYAESGDTSHEIAAVIALDTAGRIISQELVWARNRRGR